MGFFVEPLEHEINLHGQILVSRTGDDFSLPPPSPFPPVYTFKTSPCVPAPHPHVLRHVDVLPVHTGVFQRVTPHTTPHTTHTPQPQPQPHTTTTTITTHNQPTNSSFFLNTEKSPASDTARIDRLIALSSFSVWFLHGRFLSWWSDLSGYFLSRARP